MKQKALKLLSLICAMALMLSVVSVGFVASAAEASFSSSTSLSSVDNSYASVYGTNHLANSTMTYSLVGDTTTWSGTHTPNFTKLTDGLTDSRQMIQPSGAMMGDSATNYTQKEEYLQFQFALKGTYNDLQKFLFSFDATGGSLHYEIFASDSADTLYSNSLYERSVASDASSMEHIIDISALELKGIKYFGIRFYNLQLWGDCMLPYEIAVYGGKNIFQGNAETTSDDYATRFGDNWLTTSSYTSSAVVDGSAGTLSSAPSSILVDNLWSTGRAMYQGSGMNADNNEDGQTDTYFQTTFTLASPINNPETAFIAWANTNSKDTASQESHHYEIFASDSLDDLYTKSIYKHYTSSDFGWEHQIDISDQNLKGIKYYGIRIYHRTAALWNSIMVVTEIGLYGGSALLTSKSGLTSDDSGSYAAYGANRLAGATATYSITDPENANQEWSSTTQNPSSNSAIKTGLVDNTSTSIAHIQPKSAIGTVNDWTQTAEYIEFKYEFSDYLSNPSKFMLVARNAGELSPHYAIFASTDEDKLFDAPVYEFSGSVSGIQEHHIDLSFFELKNIKYFAVRFYAPTTTSAVYLLLKEVALYGGTFATTTQSGLTSDDSGSYAAYGANRLANSSLSYSIAEATDTTWKSSNLDPDKSVLTSNSSSDANQIQPNASIGTDGDITQKDEYVELVFNLNNYLSDPEKLMLVYRNAGEGSQHFEMFASTAEGELFNSSVYEFSSSSVAGWQELHVDLSSFELKNIKYIGFRFYELHSAAYLLLRELAVYGGTEYSIVTSSSALSDDDNNTYNYGENMLAGSNVTSVGMFEGSESAVNGSYVVNGTTLTDNSTAVGNLIWYSNSWNDSYSDNENTYIELTFELAGVLNNPEKFLFAKEQASYENDAANRCYTNWYAIYASDSLDTLYNKPFYVYNDYSANSVEDIIDLSFFELEGIKYFGIRAYDLSHNVLIRPSEIALYGGEMEPAAKLTVNNSSTAVNSLYEANHLTGLDGTFSRVYGGEDMGSSTAPANFTDLSQSRGLTTGADNEPNLEIGNTTDYHQLTYKLNFAVDNPDHLLISFSPTEGSQCSSQHYAVYMSANESTLYTDGLVYEYITKGEAGVGVEHEIDVSELALQDIKYVGIRFYHRNWGGKHQFISELGLFGGTTEDTFSYRDTHMNSFATAYGTNNLAWGAAESLASDGTTTAFTGAPGSNLTDSNPATLTMLSDSNSILTESNNDIEQTSAYLQLSFDLMGTLDNPTDIAIAFHEGTSNGVTSQHYAIFAAASRSALYDDTSKVYEYKSDTKQGIEHHIDLTKLDKSITGAKFIGIRFYNRGYNNNTQHLSDFGVYGGTFTANQKLDMTVNAASSAVDNSYATVYGKNQLANGSLTYSYTSDLSYSSNVPNFSRLTDGSIETWNQIQPTTGKIGQTGIYGQYFSYLDIKFNLNSALNSPDKFLIYFGNAAGANYASQHYEVYFLADGETVETTANVYKYQSATRENAEHIINLSEMTGIKSVVVRVYESYESWILPSEIAVYGGAYEFMVNSSATMVDGDYTSVYGENMLKYGSLAISATAKDLGDVSSTNGSNNSVPLTDGLGYDGTGSSRVYIENKTLKESKAEDGTTKLYANDYTQTDNYIDLTFALNGVLNNPETFMMAWPSDNTQSQPSLHYVLYASDSLDTLYDNPIRTYQNASRQGVEHIFDLSSLNLTNVKYFGVRFYERMAWDLLLMSEMAVYGGEYESALSLAGSVIMGDEEELNNYDIQYRVDASKLTFKSITDMGMLAGFKFELQNRNSLDSINKAIATELLKKNAAGSTKFYNTALLGSEQLYFHVLNSGSSKALDDRSGYAIYAIGYITFTDAEGREISLWSNTMTKSSKQISRTQARDFYNEGGEYKEIADASYAGYDFTNSSTDISKVREYVAECSGLDPNMTTVTTQVVTDGVLNESFLEKGRTYVLDSALGLDNSASGIEFNAYCRGDITIKVNANGESSLDNKGAKFVCVVDGEETYDLIVPAGSNEYDLTVATGLKQGNHTIGIYRMTPSKLDLISVTLKGEMLDAPERKAQTISFIGDSITVGHYSVITVTTTDGETITDYDGSKIKDLKVDIWNNETELVEVQNKDWDFIQVSGGVMYVGNSTSNTAYSLSEYSYQIKFTDENGNTRYLAENTSPSGHLSNSYDTYAVKTAKALGMEWEVIGMSGNKLENVVNANSYLVQTYRDNSVEYTPAADIVVVNMATNSFYSGSNASNYASAMEGIVEDIRTASPTARIIFAYGSMRNDALGVYLDSTWTAGTYDIAEHHANIVAKAAELDDTYGDIYSFGFSTISRDGGAAHPSMSEQERMAEELTAFINTAFTDVYVDQANGNDNNIGSEGQPVKTLDKAAALASDDDVIKVIGTYTVDSSERVGDSSKAIVIEGADSNANLQVTTMVFDGDTTIDNIKVNFVGNTTHDSESVSGFVYAQYNNVTFGSGVTTTSTSGTVGAYAYGGHYDSYAWADTNLTINGGTWYRVFGNSDKHNGVANNTHVTIGGNAVVDEVFGGGHYITDSSTTYNSVAKVANVTINGGTICRIFGGGRGSVAYANSTNVVINGGTYYEGSDEIGMSVFGGTTYGATVNSTKVTMNGGVVNQIFGGNEGNSLSYGSNCKTEIYLLGGKLTYRVYGGCYNYVSTGGFSITFESNNYVNGSTYVYVSDEVNMAFDDPTAESYMGYNDKSLSATSRVDLRETSAAYVTGENATLEFESQAKYDEIKNGEHMGNSYTEGYNPYDTLIIAGVTQ